MPAAPRPERWRKPSAAFRNGRRRIRRRRLRRCRRWRGSRSDFCHQYVDGRAAQKRLGPDQPHGRGAPRVPTTIPARDRRRVADPQHSSRLHPRCGPAVGAHRLARPPQAATQSTPPGESTGAPSSDRCAVSGSPTIRRTFLVGEYIVQLEDQGKKPPTCGADETRTDGPHNPLFMPGPSDATECPRC